MAMKSCTLQNEISNHHKHCLKRLHTYIVQFKQNIWANVKLSNDIE